ncbi:MAG: flagellar assembly protein FliH [Holophagales bacterium]|jgi:flagellar biosynthesis/type III secretory pathway protein FliH|nr:flagellar assembly protein FliH [Holophagales bacterium]
MSLDARITPAKDIDANRVKLYPYKSAYTPPDLEDILPTLDTEEPLGKAYLETPEEVQKRLVSLDKLIENKLAQTEQLIAKKIADVEQKNTEAEQKNTEAEQIISEKLVKAEQDAKEIAQRAYEEGYASGEKEGRTFGESQFKVHLSRLEDNLEDLSNAVSLIKSASEEETLALITVMAEYLAGQQLDAAAEAVGPLLRSILEAHPFPLSESAAPGEPAIVIFMHPKDLDQVQLNIAEEYPGVRLTSDAELSRGSLKLETADTVLDSTFERRRERLLNLVNHLKEEGHI